MGTGTIILIVIGVLILIVAAWVISAYNGFVAMRNRVEEAFSTMDVFMKKRYTRLMNQEHFKRLRKQEIWLHKQQV